MKNTTEKLLEFSENWKELLEGQALDTFAKKEFAALFINTLSLCQSELNSKLTRAYLRNKGVEDVRTGPNKIRKV